MREKNERTNKQLISRQAYQYAVYQLISMQLFGLKKKHLMFIGEQLTTAYRKLPTDKLNSCLLNSCLLISCLLISSCYEPKEGCLDAEATNFNANADDPCIDCCEYPSLSVSFLHKVATSDSTTANLIYNTPYTVDSTHFFKINKIRFYISDFQLVHSDGSLNTVNDSIDLKIPQESGDTSQIRLPNTFILVDKDNFQSNSLGSFIKSGNFGGIQFQIGIIETANHADPNQLSDEHPLSLQEASMHWDTKKGYIFNQIALFPDTIVTDSIIVQYGTDEKLEAVSLDTSFFIPKGFNITLVLQIDYLKWFEGIHFEEDDENKMAQQIQKNIVASISLVEIKLE